MKIQNIVLIIIIMSFNAYASKPLPSPKDSLPGGFTEEDLAKAQENFAKMLQFFAARAKEEKESGELVRKRVTFSNRGQTLRHICYFSTSVEFFRTNETVKAGNGEIPLNLWVALKKQIDSGALECTKNFTYQPRSIFPNKGVIHFPPEIRKCTLKANDEAVAADVKKLCIRVEK